MTNIDDLGEIFAKITEEYEEPVPIGGAAKAVSIIVSEI